MRAGETRAPGMSQNVPECPRMSQKKRFCREQRNQRFVQAFETWFITKTRQRAQAPARAQAQPVVTHSLTYVLTCALTYSRTDSLALFTICVKASCAQRKQQQFKALRQWLLCPPHPESEKKSPSKFLGLCGYSIVHGVRIDWHFLEKSSVGSSQNDTLATGSTVRELAALPQLIAGVSVTMQGVIQVRDLLVLVRTSEAPP